MANVIIQSYYVSSGRKNAMYTLRYNRWAPNIPAFDVYVCNLAVDVDKALAKAVEYVDAMRDRIGEHSGEIVFDGVVASIHKRRGKLSIDDTRKIEIIEAGIFPFGKHANMKIMDAPDSYILFFADKLKDDGLDPVMLALASACMGVALETGLIAKREAARDKRAEADALSNFVGSVGERREFTGEVVTCFSKGITAYGEYQPMYWVNKVRCGTDLISYVGSKALGKVGEPVTFRATIKKHDLYNGIRSTVVSRPS